MGSNLNDNDNVGDAVVRATSVLIMIISNGIFIMGMANPYKEAGAAEEELLPTEILYNPRQYSLGPSPDLSASPGSLSHYLAPLPGTPASIEIPHGSLRYIIGNKDAGLVRLYFQVITPKQGITAERLNS